MGAIVTMLAQLVFDGVIFFFNVLLLRLKVSVVTLMIALAVLVCFMCVENKVTNIVNTPTRLTFLTWLTCSALQTGSSVVGNTLKSLTN